MTTRTVVHFYFDPLCPWAWRASLWIREAAQVRPLDVHWHLFSLEINNNGPDGVRQEFRSGPAFRVIELLRRQQPDDLNPKIDAFYRALGQAAHDRQQNIGEHDITRAALQEAGLDEKLLDTALNDDSTLEAVIQAHAKTETIKAFGVPTLVLNHPETDYRTTGAFGPVITTVPTGEAAGQLWDLVEGLIRRPEFFELKIPR